MLVYVNDRPVPRVSRITQSASQPFEIWCTNICQLIQQQINGEYELIYTGRSCEARLLGQIARNYPYCKSFRANAPIFSDTALIRLRKLSNYVQSGLSCGQLSASIHIYTDIPSLDDYLITPRLAFCRIRIILHELKDLASHSPSEPAYIILSDKNSSDSIHLSSLKISRGVILHADGKQCALNIRDGLFEEHFSLQNCITILGSYLELWTFTDILKCALETVRINESSHMYLRVKALDKQEPITQVVLPESIEYGEIEKIKIYTIPEGAIPEEVHYRISDESVISLVKDGLKAEGIGEAVVQAYIPGRNTLATQRKISCYKRNRITSLKLSHKSIDMLEGSEFLLTFTYSPNDADDVDSVQISSSNEKIAYATNRNIIKARHEGKCVIHVTSKKVSVQCVITVYPKLLKLNINIHSIDTITGNVIKFQISRYPKTATLQKLIYTVSPSSLGRYELGANGFYASGEGIGKLTVSAQDDNSVSVSIPVTVRPQNNSEGLSGKIIAGIIVGIIIILYILLKG